MNISRRALSIGLGALGAGQALSSAHAEGILSDLTADVEDFRSGVEAYIFGYPLVTMEMTRRGN